MGISILTFGGTVQLGELADAALVEDRGVLVGAIEAEFEALGLDACDQPLQWDLPTPCAPICL